MKNNHGDNNLFRFQIYFFIIILVFYSAISIAKQSLEGEVYRIIVTKECNKDKENCDDYKITFKVIETVNKKQIKTTSFHRNKKIGNPLVSNFYKKLNATIDVIDTKKIGTYGNVWNDYKNLLTYDTNEMKKIFAVKNGFKIHIFKKKNGSCKIKCPRIIVISNQEIYLQARRIDKLKNALKKIAKKNNIYLSSLTKKDEDIGLLEKKIVLLNNNKILSNNRIDGYIRLIYNIFVLVLLFAVIIISIILYKKNKQYKTEKVSEESHEIGFYEGSDKKDLIKKINEDNPDNIDKKIYIIKIKNDKYYYIYAKNHTTDCIAECTKYSKNSISKTKDENENIKKFIYSNLVLKGDFISSDDLSKQECKDIKVYLNTDKELCVKAFNTEKKIFEDIKIIYFKKEINELYTNFTRETGKEIEEEKPLFTYILCNINAKYYGALDYHSVIIKIKEELKTKNKLSHSKLDDEKHNNKITLKRIKSYKDIDDLENEKKTKENTDVILAYYDNITSDYSFYVYNLKKNKYEEISIYCYKEEIDEIISKNPINIFKSDSYTDLESQVLEYISYNLNSDHIGYSPGILMQKMLEILLEIHHGYILNGMNFKEEIETPSPKETEIPISNSAEKTEALISNSTEITKTLISNSDEYIKNLILNNNNIKEIKKIKEILEDKSTSHEIFENSKSSKFSKQLGINLIDFEQNAAYNLFMRSQTYCKEIERAFLKIKIDKGKNNFIRFCLEQYHLLELITKYELLEEYALLFEDDKKYLEDNFFDKWRKRLSQAEESCTFDFWFKIDFLINHLLIPILCDSDSTIEINHPIFTISNITSQLVQTFRDAASQKGIFIHHLNSPHIECDKIKVVTQKPKLFNELKKNKEHHETLMNYLRKLDRKVIIDIVTIGIETVDSSGDLSNNTQTEVVQQSCISELN